MRKDKQREAEAGHDGTWAAHPGLIPTIVEVFNSYMGHNPNQIHHTAARGDAAATVTEADLLEPPRGTRTTEGLRLNTRVGIQYLATWLKGIGSVPLYGLMEDAATAEISRVQSWQWLKYGAVLDLDLDGSGIGAKATRSLFERVVEEEMGRIGREVGKVRFENGMYEEACNIFTRQCLAPDLDDFLTLDAYKYIVVFE